MYALRLFGPFHFGFTNGPVINFSTKQQALIAMLATAPENARTRAWLQAQLWGNVGQAQASGSLRSALASIRKLTKSGDAQLILSNRDRVTINMNLVTQVSRPESGEFLEGLDVKHEQGFNDWLREERSVAEAEAELNRAKLTTAPQALVRAAASPLMPAPLPERFDAVLPRIGVMPFESRRHGAMASALGDALADEVQRTLSRSNIFEVVSQLSTREAALSRDPMMARSLGANFLMTGNIIERGDDSYAVTVDLHDFDRGVILWSREYLGETGAFLNGDNAQPLQIAQGAAFSIIQRNEQLIQTTPLPDLKLHDKLIGAIGLIHGPSSEGINIARRTLHDLIDHAPKQPVLHAWLGKAHVMAAQRGLQKDIKAAANEAISSTSRALDLDPYCSVALSFEAFAYSHLKHDYTLADTLHDEALKSDPNNAFSWLLKSVTNAFRDEGGKAVEYAQKSLRLSPCDPQLYFFECLTATAYLTSGDYPVALDYATRSIGRNPVHPSSHRVKTIALQRLGRDEEAHQAAQRLLQVEPDLTLRKYLSKHPAAAFRTGQDWAAALGEAGIPA